MDLTELHKAKNDAAFQDWLRRIPEPSLLEPDEQDYEAAKLGEGYCDPDRAREVELDHNYHLARDSKLMRLYLRWKATLD
jgi:hypothetical protein